jgi:RNase P subunit RPR2
MRVAKVTSGKRKAKLRRSIKRLCPLCQQGIDRRRSVQSYYRFLLHGAVRYGVCPECLLEVMPPWSAAYRLRYDLRVEDVRRAKSLCRPGGIVI